MTSVADLAHAGGAAGRRSRLAVLATVACFLALPGMMGARSAATPTSGVTSCPAAGTVGWQGAGVNFTASAANFGTITRADYLAGYKDIDVTVGVNSSNHDWALCVEATAANLGAYPGGGTKALSDLQWRLVSFNGTTQPDNGFYPITQSYIYVGGCTACSITATSYDVRLRLLLDWAKDAPNTDGTSRTYSVPIQWMLGDRNTSSW